MFDLLSIIFSIVILSFILVSIVALVVLIVDVVNDLKYKKMNGYNKRGSKK